MVLKNLDEIDVGTHLIRFDCDKPVLCNTEIIVPNVLVEMLGSEH